MPIPQPVLAALAVLEGHAQGNPDLLSAVLRLKALVVPIPAVPAAVEGALNTLWTYAAGDHTIETRIVDLKHALGLT